MIINFRLNNTLAALLVDWYVEENMTVRRQDALLDFSYNTQEGEHKIVTVYAPSDGVITKRYKHKNDTIKIGDILGAMDSMVMVQFALPKIIPDYDINAKIVEWYVEENAAVKFNDLLLSVSFETQGGPDKIVKLPSPATGVLIQKCISTRVCTGDVLCVIKGMAMLEVELVTPDVQEAQVLKWYAEENDAIEVGTPLVSFAFQSKEGAKKVVVLPSPVTGVLSHQSKKVSDTVKTGDVLGIVGRGN